MVGGVEDGPGDQGDQGDQGELLATLLQIFATVFAGWVAGSLHVLGPQEAKGLALFVGKFSLPALVFISLASLNLDNIKWSFILAILISKSVIFTFVLVSDFLINKDISRAAIFAIYSTQTNDFGMGLPILTSVYGQDSSVVGLLYLVAPISLLFLNPIAFTLLEVDRVKLIENKESTEKGDEKQHKDQHLESKGSLKALLSVLKGLISNPVIAMTVLGVIANSVFSSEPPLVLTKTLKPFGAAFSSLAPFSLGLSMVGKFSGINANKIKPILSLLVIKSIISPMISYLMVGEVGMLVDGGFSPEFANLGLLLACFPTALGVASYSTEYSVATDFIPAAIVLGTVSSAPLMYQVAKFLAFLSDPSGSLGRSRSWDDSLFSIISATIILARFLTRPDWRRPPSSHQFSMLMLLLTLLSATCGLLHYLAPWPPLLLLHLTSLHASRLTTPCLTFHLYSLVRSQQDLTSPPILHLLLLGPLFSISTLLLLLSPYSPENILPFGELQDRLNLAIQVTSLLPTLLFLLLLSKAKRYQGSEEQLGLLVRGVRREGIQLFRHTVLALLLSTAMVVSISLSMARILLKESAATPELKVVTSLEVLCSSGQGLIFLAVFGADQEAGRVARELGASLMDRLKERWWLQGAQGCSSSAL